MNQLTLFDAESTKPPAPIPGQCPHEAKVLDIGGKKSFCAPWDTWTNCREVGYCVKERWHGKKP